MIPQGESVEKLHPKFRLFEPDNLSRYKPEYVPFSDQEASEQICEMLRYHYRPHGEPKSIELYAGKNVTSLNFVVKTTTGSFALKRKPLVDLNVFEPEMAQQKYFADEGLPVPEIFLSDSGSLISQFGNYAWSLSQFVEGHYFTGESTEIESTSNALARFVEAAERAKSKPLGFERVESNDFLNRLPRLIERCATELKDPAAREKIKEYADQILFSLRLVQNSEISNSPIAPVHLDFHPLNVLLLNGRIAAVLDFQYFYSIPLEVGVGFAYYKLIRQHIVASKISMPSSELRTSWLARWVEAWNAVHRAHLSLRSSDLLRLGATYRILFILDKILGEMVAGNNRFAHDLEKQLRSLIEIDFLFPTTYQGQTTTHGIREV